MLCYDRMPRLLALESIVIGSEQEQACIEGSLQAELPIPITFQGGAGSQGRFPDSNWGAFISLPKAACPF